jgi:hypothetical protein
VPTVREIEIHRSDSDGNIVGVIGIMKGAESGTAFCERNHGPFNGSTVIDE